MKKTGSESVTTSSVQNQMALCHQAMVEITKQFLMFELQQSNILAMLKLHFKFISCRLCLGQLLSSANVRFPADELQLC